MLEGAVNGEGFLNANKLFTTQNAAKSLNSRLGQAAQIGDGTLDGLFAVAAGLAKKDGRRRVAVGDAFDVHGCRWYHIVYINARPNIHISPRNMGAFSQAKSTPI